MNADTIELVQLIASIHWNTLNPNGNNFRCIKGIKERKSFASELSDKILLREYFNDGSQIDIMCYSQKTGFFKAIINIYKKPIQCKLCVGFIRNAQTNIDMIPRDICTIIQNYYAQMFAFKCLDNDLMDSTDTENEDSNT